MSTKIQALLWELWRANRWRLLMVFCGMLLTPGVISVSMTPRDWKLPEQEGVLWHFDSRPMTWEAQLATVLINSVICVLGIGYCVGYPTRHYTSPITTRQLTLVRLFAGASACAMLYLLIASLFNAFFGSGLPYFGPMLTYAITFATGYAIVSYVHSRENLRTLAVILFAPLVVYWITGHYPTYWKFGPHFQWPGLSVTEFILCTLIGISAWRFTEDGLALDRRGKGWAHPSVGCTDVEPCAPSRLMNFKRFRSPFAALFWQEWRQDGWLWPLAISCTYGLPAIIYLTADTWQDGKLEPMNVPAIINLNFAYMAFAAFLPWCVGVISSQGRKSQVDKCLPTSISTLPVSDATFAWVTMARSMASVAMAWLCIMSIGFAGYLLYVVTGSEISWSSPDSLAGGPLAPSTTVPWFILLIFVAWNATGVGAATGLSGRSWLAFLPIAGIGMWIATFLLICSLEQSIGRPATESLARVIATGILFAFAIGMLAAYFRTLKRKIIGVKSLVLGLTILLVTEWISIVACLSNDWTIASPANFPYYWRLWILLALAAAPPAVVPLAVHFNRHR